MRLFDKAVSFLLLSLTMFELKVLALLSKAVIDFSPPKMYSGDNVL